MRLLLAIIALTVAIVAVMMFFRSRRTVVLGGQAAEADARDRLHREQFGHLASPLPALRYERDRGEDVLIDPRASELDLQLRSVSARFAAAPAEERRDLRAGARGDDFDTLLNFARRASVFALREHDGKRVEEALNAVAMIDAARIDERDLPLTLSLIHHAADRLRLPASRMFDAAASVSAPRTSEIIRSFVRQSATDKDIEASWRYQEIDAPNGAGFVQRGFEAYEPSRDLLRSLLAFREEIRRDRYEGDVMLATELPSVWFPESARERAESILAHLLGAGSLNGTLRSREHERAGAQSFFVFIVEARSAQDAAALRMLADRSEDDDLPTIAVHDGPLFALAVARSSEVGVPSYETRESIKRFEGPLRAALREAGGYE